VTWTGAVFVGPGFSTGIDYSGGTVSTQIKNITVSGCMLHGILLPTNLGNSTKIESCSARVIGAIGLAAENIESSMADQCGSMAILGRIVNDSGGYSVGPNYGIYAGSANNCFASAYGANPALSAITAINCSGTCYGAGMGLAATSATNCYGSSFSNNGIDAETAIGCRGSSDSGSGLHATVAFNCKGSSATNRGITADIASSCWGVCNGASYGLFATKIGTACYGFSNTGVGVYGYILNSCVGETNFGTLANYTYHYNMPP
jgi:hypothetical protein